MANRPRIVDFDWRSWLFGLMGGVYFGFIVIALLFFILSPKDFAAGINVADMVNTFAVVGMGGFVAYRLQYQLTQKIEKDKKRGGLIQLEKDFVNHHVDQCIQILKSINEILSARCFDQKVNLKQEMIAEGEIDIVTKYRIQKLGDTVNSEFTTHFELVSKARTQVSGAFSLIFQSQPLVAIEINAKQDFESYMKTITGNTSYTSPFTDVKLETYEIACNSAFRTAYSSLLRLKVEIERLE